MHWYFGYGAGLDFSNGSPVVDTTSKIKSSWATETSFTLSDTCGNLLLYGVDTIFSGNHQFVYDLQINNSLMQMLAIPQPGNDSIVYIFYENSYEQRIYYAVVNLKLNGGNGGLISNDSLIGNWNTRATQKLAAYKHCNGQDIWIITKLGYAPYSKDIYAFLLTSSGLNLTPIVSNVVQNPLIFENDGGCIRFSPDGSKLVALYDYWATSDIGNPDSNFVELYQFDKCSGQFSNPLIWNFQTPYYAAFSPDSKKLYVATFGDYDTAFIGGGCGADSSFIVQYDVSNYNINVILSSQFMFYFADTLFGQMQLGPDGKIYVADINRWGFLNNPNDSSTYKSGIINNPNNSGVACNYQLNFLNLLRPSIYGFPNFVDSYFSSLEFQNCDIGVQEISSDNGVIIYPNPASDLINIQCRSSGINKIKIYNAIGELCLEKNINSENTVIDIHSLSSGLYVIQFYQNKNQSFINKKIIKL